MPFGPEALDLEQLEQRGRELRQQRVALFERAALGELLEHAGDAFADARNFGDFALGVGKNVVDALGIAFDGRSGVAIGADAKAVFAGNLHQVRGLGEHAREFTIFHVGPGLTIVPSMCGSTCTSTSATQSTSERIFSFTCVAISCDS